MSLFNRLTDWLIRNVILPPEEDVYADMEQEEPRRKIPPLECYENSLRFSLKDAVKQSLWKNYTSKVETRVRLGTWTIAAPVWELPPGTSAYEIVEFSIDFPFDSDPTQTLWFELDYQHYDRISGNAVYIARCDNL
jgi:hypothetical protein